MRPLLALLAAGTALAAAEASFSKQTLTKDFVAEGVAVAPLRGGAENLIHAASDIARRARCAVAHRGGDRHQ